MEATTEAGTSPKTTPTSDQRLVRVLTWLVTALVALPLLSPGWLPFTDLGEHAAAMGSIAHYGDAEYRIAEHYTIAWTQSQYMLAHVVGAALAKITGSVEVSIKLLFVGLVVAWVQSSRLLLRAFRADERLAILAALLFWNRALGLGFLPYVASLPALFATLAMFVEGIERPPSWKREVALALAAIGVFYTHASAFTLLATLSCAHAGIRALGRGRRTPFVSRLLWLIPSALLAGLWVARGRFAVHAASIHSDAEIGTMDPVRALKVAPLWAHDIWTSHVDEIVGIAFWAMLLALYIAPRGDGRAPRVPAIVPFVVGLVVYLVTPFRVGTGVLLNVRMSPVLELFAMLAIRPRPGGNWRAFPVYGGVVLALVQCVDNVRHVRDFQHDVDGLPELLATLPRGARVITLSFSGMDPNRAHAPPWLYPVSYHRANRGGVASFSFSELAHWSVQYRPEAAPPNQGALSWAVAPCLYRNERDGAYFDFVVVRGAVDPFRDHPRGPTWRIRGRTAKYTLWEKDGGVADGPDEGPCHGLARPPGG